MAMRPSFRPRPIDSSKPLPIVRTSKDLRHEDDVVVSRALPEVGTGVEAAELEERHLQQALLASVYGEGAQKADIPIPVFRTVTPPRQKGSGPFQLPRDHYILFDRSDADLEDSFVDYDGDHVDEHFVRKYNAAHKKSPTLLSMDALERTMDRLEKLQGRTIAEEEEEEGDVVLPKVDTKKGAAANAAAAAAAAAAAKRSLSRETILQFSQIRQELVALLPNCSDAGRREIYAHWADRRLAHGIAFHRLYIKPPAADDPNPGVAFRPRGREDGGGGRRMNTYDNYKRAVLLREEFDILRNVMQSVVARERVKLDHLTLAALQTRIKCVAAGGSRLGGISRNIAAHEREGFIVGSGDSRIVVSCRGLPAELPSEVQAFVTRGPFGLDRSKAKKAKRRSGAGDKAGGRSDVRAGAGSSVIGAPSATGVGINGGRGRDGAAGSRDPRQSSAGNQQNGVDSFGFDEHGNRFLKHMRYFAGGFMNYGVCPYDHRVFAAASERNTVKELPSEPKPFLFPTPQLPLAMRATERGGKSRPAKHGGTAFDAASKNKSSRVEQRPHLARPPPASNPLVNFGSGVSKRKRRPLKVRARVGRGGRIVLDRVVFEPERGVKAASYPASVEMGGVYTGGLPLEATAKVAAENSELSHLRGFGFDEHCLEEEKKLVQPLQPMVVLADGRPTEDNRIVCWPSRQKRAAGGINALVGTRVAVDKAEPNESMHDGECVQKDVDMSDGVGIGDVPWYVSSDAEELRRMPAYAHRMAQSVQLVEHLSP